MRVGPARGVTALIAVAATAMVAAWPWMPSALGADRAPGQCDHARIVTMTAEPNPTDARCNPMLTPATVSLGGVRWAQYGDDVCKWYWDYAMARSQMFSAYLNGYNVPGYGWGPAFTLGGVQTTMRFAVVGPPLYPKVAVFHTPAYAAKNGHGEWTRLGPAPEHHDARLDPYVHAVLSKVRPLALPKPMQDVYGGIVRAPNETQTMVHGVYFTATYRTFSSAEAPGGATYKVHARCHQYVTVNWARQQHRVGWAFTPLIPGQRVPGDDSDFDLLPR